METFRLSVKETLTYDVVVCGGGFAGAAAAWAAAVNGAKTLVIDSGGELSGDISKGLVTQILDPKGKGGLVRELNDFLNAGGNTAARRGPRYDENGRRIPGTVVNMEYVKYYLEKRCLDAGADILYHSIVAGCELEGDAISSLGVATECGSYRVKAKVYIDASGNGILAAMAGCEYEIGHPETGEPQPASISTLVTGLPNNIIGINTAEKERIKRELAEKGVPISAEFVTVFEYAVDNIWMLSFNSVFNLMCDDALAMSKAISEARAECVDVIDKMKRLPEYRDLNLVQTSSHIGIREGRRIRGRYWLTYDDITTGKKFEDAVCRVTFCIDVHRISPDDHFDHSKGKRMVPYHIPYRSLLPIGCGNLLLAGRCISGDFYAHSSYRVIGDVTPTGEAAGYAASVCVRQGIAPADVDGKEVSAFIASRGYEL